MSDAERQRRRRKRLRKEKLRLGWKAENQKKRLKSAKDYIPTPPGITYWKKVILKADGREIWYPITRPLATTTWNELQDADVLAMLEQAQKEARRRGLIQ